MGRACVRLASIGISSLADLRDRDAWVVMHPINVQAGRLIWRAPTALVALQQPIAAAEREGESSSRSPAT